MVWVIFVVCDFGNHFVMTLGYVLLVISLNKCLVMICNKLYDNVGVIECNNL